MDDPAPTHDGILLDQLERALRAAFAERLDSSARQRDGAASGAPIEGEVRRERASYRLLGEVARGGMGIVLRGHDPDLARDVAVKVLRDDLPGRDAAAARFLAEARIVGQLQHPGIVPIHEYGRMPDGRPYFAMKLIQGETLAKLLAARTSLAQDRHRMVSIFEEVCRTMAYSHARRIVHRDLKPANVMVGSFGEVQVVDWGLAKVLTRGESKSPLAADAGPHPPSDAIEVDAPAHRSMTGTVMGTPAYMPPEQARGDVEHVDERSDVFALGAILCEVLTGTPPYVGGSESVREAALTGAIDHARRALEAIHDEPELRALCLRCLSPERDARPRDAGEVARSIESHRAATAERARSAHIAAVEARVQVAAGRKALWLTAGLASSVLLSLVIGAGAWYVAQREQARRRDQTAAGVNLALDRASLLLGQASSIGGEETWQGALGEVERARALLEAGEPSQDLELRVGELARHVRAGLEAVRRRAALDASNRVLLARLQELRAPAVEGPDATDWRRVDEDYGAAFRAHELDFDAQPAAEIAATVRERGLGLEVVTALDDWSAARRRLGDPVQSEHLVRAANTIDPDAGRARLRALLAAGRTAELAEFASGADLASLPVATLSLLGGALAATGATQAASRVLRAALHVRPDDYVANVYLARLFWDVDYNESARHYSAALAVRPDDTVVIREFGYLLDHYLGVPERAIELYRRALADRPQDASLQLYLGHALSTRGEFDAALAAYEATIRIDPMRGAAFRGVVRCRHEQGDSDREIVACHELIRRFPDSSSGHLFLAQALQERGEWLESARAAETALKLDPNDHNVLECVRRTREALGDHRGALSAAHENLRRAPEFLLVLREQGVPLADVVELDSALRERQDAVQQYPASATQRALLGVLLEERGNYAQALFELRTALQLAADPATWLRPSENSFGQARRLLVVEGRAREWLAQMERRAVLEQHLELAVRGVEAPEFAGELEELARLALRRGRTLAAARLFERALSGDASMLREPSESCRIDAATAAAATGCGHDGAARELEPRDLAYWRGRAAQWMREDLAVRAQQVASSDPATRLSAAKALGHWCHARGLAGVRDAATLGTLPAAEQPTWQGLWAVAEALATRVRAAAEASAR